ncbi:phosphoribosylglycinamide formyltransferase [Aliamphritea spongicola]|uniref:phosphoribosylglycinamide formyltransferase n=1 Tax=Aliamphritea spongicola TaxID=707589 RepID=UPI00196B2E71|nr:phosphoribosylglycinamide formyltransferase [Aliamphritea spongicola]MBN3560675.1 phosphoribosylglycinamide formyltransferase [Aliamphritea spongicola]
MTSPVPAAAKRIVVLISGSGSNLQAIIDAVNAGRINGKIEMVISNKDDAYGLERARQADIPGCVIRHTDYSDRDSFDQALIAEIDSHSPDLVILAGFMRIFTPEFVNRYSDRMLNIHPSLLPKYKGLNTHQRAIEDGEARHGCTVHFVTEELDGGPLAVQAAVDILPDDTADSLQQRVHTQEHKIYPLAVEWFCNDRLQLVSGQVQLDGSSLDSQGYQFTE